MFLAAGPAGAWTRAPRSDRLPAWKRLARHPDHTHLRLSRAKLSAHSAAENPALDYLALSPNISGLRRRALFRHNPSGEGHGPLLCQRILGDVGFARGQLSSMQRLEIGWGERTVRTIKWRQPLDAGIDPYPAFVDRNRSDTILQVTASQCWRGLRWVGHGFL